MDGLAQTTFAIGAMPPKITAGIAPLSLEEPCREKQPWIILLIAKQKENKYLHYFVHQASDIDCLVIDWLHACDLGPARQEVEFCF